MCGFLKVRPMASIDWLLLRITLYRETKEEEIHSDGADLSDPLVSLNRPRGAWGLSLNTDHTTGREHWPDSNSNRQESDREH